MRLDEHYVTDAENEISRLNKRIAVLEALVCEHEWFKWEPSDNMEQCRNCRLWRDESDTALLPGGNE